MQMISIPANTTPIMTKTLMSLVGGDVGDVVETVVPVSLVGVVPAEDVEGDRSVCQE